MKHLPQMAHYSFTIMFIYAFRNIKWLVNKEKTNNKYFNIFDLFGAHPSRESSFPFTCYIYTSFSRLNPPPTFHNPFCLPFNSLTYSTLFASTTMIKGKDIYEVVAALVPLYVALILGYGSVHWWKIFTPEQCNDINRFVSVFAVPFHSISYHPTTLTPWTSGS